MAKSAARAVTGNIGIGAGGVAAAGELARRGGHRISASAVEAASAAYNVFVSVVIYSLMNLISCIRLLAQQYRSFLLLNSVAYAAWRKIDMARSQTGQA